ncbi:MAG: TRAP transporter substrate-binding protein DctP [Nitrospinae bacterium]|nr:TRAP transporter substrate-binding protein DctP [Nitrospinota bacterium]
MATSWPPGFPVFQTGMEQFAARVKEMSGGRLSIRVYAGGELIPPLEVFDAISAGTVEMGHSASYYWAGKAPELQLFTTSPFGLTAQQFNAWFYHGGGLELMHEMYKPYNIITFPSCNTGVQMGGWFNRKIERIEDFNGLKMRIPGLGGRVVAKAGVNVVLMAAGELYTALERGTIDALEWVGPYHDLKLGFYRAAKYYYYPGWHEPGTMLELMVNLKAWESLPKDLQMIVEAAAAQSNLLGLAEFDAKNGEALNELVNTYKAQVLKFPDEVLKTLHGYAREVLEEEAAKSPGQRKVYDAFRAFAGRVEPWTRMSERAFMEAKGL